MSEPQSRPTNRLINETSPYLLQHAHNPVDWYPWGEEALSRARAENKPILLSVGYSACHWCHVMERESFENPAIAELMNRNYVNIKVDREERPDIDSIYMDAVVAMTQRGGWPMTVFLTPEGVPFFGGTYFPPDRRYPGMPSFPEVLQAVAESYRDRPEDVAHNALQLKTMLQEQGRFEGFHSTTAPALSKELLDLAWSLEGVDRQGRPATGGLLAQFDQNQGGIGHAPKFPQPMALEFTLRTHHRTGDPQARQLLELTLTRMAYGGIYDQLGGGFHRYSTDARWLVPHFEKMLYDNAQLSLLYLQAYQAFGHPLYKRIAVQTLDYVIREMTGPDGGFYSTQDADSEGEEGKFFVWTLPEIVEALGTDDAAIFCRFYDVTASGNWERHNILNIPRPVEEVAPELNLSPEQLLAVLHRSNTILFEHREHRVHPGRDEKILTAWNGMMLKSFALAARILERDDYLQVALENAAFVLTTMRTPEGRFYRTSKDGHAHLNGFLEDYSCYADGLLALYEATFDLRWLHEARQLAAIMLDKFWDDAGQGFYDTASDHEQLVTRPRSLYDNATPSGNSVATDVLLRLALLTGDPENIYRPRAETILRQLAPVAVSNPAAFGRLLSALDFYLGEPAEIVIVGDEAEEATHRLLRVIYQHYLSNRVVMLWPETQVAPGPEWPLLQDRPRLNGQPTAYVCRNYACRQPVTGPHELKEQLHLPS